MCLFNIGLIGWQRNGSQYTNYGYNNHHLYKCETYNFLFH